MSVNDVPSAVIKSGSTGLWVTQDSPKSPRSALPIHAANEPSGPPSAPISRRMLSSASGEISPSENRAR